MSIAAGRSYGDWRYGRIKSSAKTPFMDELYGLKLDDLLKLRFYLCHIPSVHETTQKNRK